MRILVSLLFLAASVFAESFGGIGVTIQSSPKGVQIVTVLPGSPASMQNLVSGDQIVSVNGINLAGKPLEDITAMLRGTSGETVQISVSKAKDGEVWVGNLTRANLQVQEIAPKDIESWYQNSSNLSQEEVEHFATLQAADGFELLGILQYGRLVAQGEKLAPQKVSTVYMGAAETPRPEVQPPLAAKISLLAFNRQKVLVGITIPGDLSISVFDLQGQEIQNWKVSNAQAGEVSLSWSASKVPSQGSYVMVARQGNAKTSWEVQLR